jgi:dephospho-CoA kinase
MSADAVVHELLGDPSVRDRLLDRWGGEVVADGTVDRGRVGAIVFDSTEELAWLESLLHPLVGARLAAWGSGLAPEVELAVVEVPLLFETSMEDSFDATVAVVAADETRARRAGLRGTEMLEARSDRQLPQEEKAARATYVLVNDGSLETLERAVAALMERLTQSATSSA